MSDKWFYAQGKQEIGPLTGKELKTLAITGRLQRKDRVRKQGMTTWVRADSVKGLFPEQDVQDSPPPLSDPDIRTTVEPTPHEAESASPRKRASEPSPRGSLVLAIAGSLLFLGGVLFGVGYFNMDTSVEVPKTEILGRVVGGGRVHNIGLLADRQNGLILSVVAAVGGLILAHLGTRK